MDELAGELRHEEIAYRAYLPPQPPRFAEPSTALPAPVRSVLERMEVERLYCHQAEALDLVRRGQDVAVVTPTASGKSLVFYLPIIEAVLAEPGSRALCLFPYKALEQDQLQTLQSLGQGLFSGVHLSADIYDGDTPASRRKKIKAALPDVLITNPDMLHVGILPYHGEWREFFAHLRYVVVDELHVYRGIFGSHLAQVMRRLWRICARCGSRPRLIACSATVGNPLEFASALTGRAPAVVADSGAPRAGRHFLFINPQGSPYTAATSVVARTVEAGYKTIAFTKARKITELMHSWLLQSHPRLRGKVASYRAGYLPEERREIERRLFRGELWGVVSTSALELGIDVGELDVCVLAGYPGSVMSSWQRIGRVGRQGRESLTVLVALPDALDQYFMKRPSEFFERPFERAVLDPDNREIASAHLVCAGAEAPLNSSDAAFYPGSGPLFERLVHEGRLLRDASGENLYSLKRRPHREVSLRSAGESFAIVDAGTGRTIGSIDGVRVFHECHEGAIYLHAGVQYQILRLDIDRRRVEARPCDVDYYTQPIGDKETEILETWSLARRGCFGLGLGRLKVTVRLSGYERRRIHFQGRGDMAQHVLSRHTLVCPPIVFETVGLWLVIPDELQRRITAGEGHFMGGLHAAEHAMISMFPLLALCDRNDLGGISYSFNAQIDAPAIFIYDGYPGGIGLSAGVHAGIEELIARTGDLLDGCPCEEGCPSCIQSPKCGSGNRPLDKEAARMVLAALAGRLVLEGAPAGEGIAPEPLARIETAPGGSCTPAAAFPGVETVTPPEAAARETRLCVDAPAGSLALEPAMRFGPVSSAAAFSFPSSMGVIRAPAAPESLPIWPALPRPEDGRLLFLDVETQRSAEEVGGWGSVPAMGLALAVVYEPSHHEFRTYREREVDRLLLDLMAADKVVGFNIDRFDIPVLSSYTPHDLHRIRTLDMLGLIRGRLGFRVGLGHIAEANLGAGKTADGLQSLRWFREGRFDLIESYCRQDVEITAKLFFLGRQRGYLLYRDGEGRLLRVPVDW